MILLRQCERQRLHRWDLHSACPAFYIKAEEQITRVVSYTISPANKDEALVHSDADMAHTARGILVTPCTCVRCQLLFASMAAAHCHVRIDHQSIMSSHAYAHTDDVVTQDEVCQACQRSFTAGHASKRLTLKGRPYKQLWQYGFR